MGTIAVDAGHYPTYVTTFDGPVDDNAFLHYLDVYGHLLLTQRKYALILDARRAGMTPSSQRAAQAKWMKERGVIIKRCCVGIAFVIDNPLVRGILTAILWAQPLDATHVIVKTFEEAAAWTNARLVAAQLQPHSAMLARARGAA